LERNLAAPATGVAVQSRYLPDADLVDALIEQVEYLVRHGSERAAGCADCARMARMKACLLRPFSPRAEPS